MLITQQFRESNYEFHRQKRETKLINLGIRFEHTLITKWVPRNSTQRERERERGGEGLK